MDETRAVLHIGNQHFRYASGVASGFAVIADRLARLIKLQFSKAARRKKLVNDIFAIKLQFS